MKIENAEKIVSSRGFDLKKLRDKGAANCPCGEWGALWTRYGELMACVGNCPFTEAVDCLEAVYLNQ